jgi:hypothetical protein
MDYSCAVSDCGLSVELDEAQQVFVAGTTVRGTVTVSAGESVAAVGSEKKRGFSASCTASTLSNNP